MRTSAPAWTSTGAPGTDERASTRPSNGTGKATLSGVNGAALAPPDLQSGEVEHQHLRELDADEPERGLRTDGGAVPVPQGTAPPSVRSPRSGSSASSSRRCWCSTSPD